MAGRTQDVFIQAERLSAYNAAPAAMRAAREKPLAAAAYAVAKHRLERAPRYLGVTAAIAALLYPIALVVFYSGEQMLRSASGWEGKPSAWLVTLGAVLRRLWHSCGKFLHHLLAGAPANAESSASSRPSVDTPRLCIPTLVHGNRRAALSAPHQQRFPQQRERETLLT